ncbi:hypothetical protein TBLA_0F03690 [Henningerozyma blattae CBS 6284]|uniref:CST complex subunit Stn1 N-terminal domain-containing protein n=1 Tax=Henningerozyma blattae (strain ATCC 34711 / CBS 6284 / DSM 70876 / NBRC 10599 / NRRL Y-10934 / UCD 77-7) TaxID=1071380 RepID=I2H6A4_HENB6|nr:hypothetical protein TBLA_0F03690 [Tetrapisispora blattae CBS 6284]CCH61906.1 hypothetical protein TBLA_0F03690 [Tetrapisispora blattae CBS 6284]
MSYCCQGFFIKLRKDSFPIFQRLRGKVSVRSRFFFYLNNPIKYLKIVGIVVGFKYIYKSNKDCLILYIDDSTNSNDPLVSCISVASLKSQLGFKLVSPSKQLVGKTIEIVGTINSLLNGADKLIQFNISTFNFGDSFLLELNHWKSIIEFKESIGIWIIDEKLLLDEKLIFSNIEKMHHEKNLNCIDQIELDAIKNQINIASPYFKTLSYDIKAQNNHSNEMHDHHAIETIDSNEGTGEKSQIIFNQPIRNPFQHHILSSNYSRVNRSRKQDIFLHSSQETKSVSIGVRPIVLDTNPSVEEREGQLLSNEQNIEVVSIESSPIRETHSTPESLMPTQVDSPLLFPITSQKQMKLKLIEEFLKLRDLKNLESASSQLLNYSSIKDLISYYTSFQSQTMELSSPTKRINIRKNLDIFLQSLVKDNLIFKKNEIKNDGQPIFNFKNLFQVYETLEKRINFFIRLNNHTFNILPIKNLKPITIIQLYKLIIKSIQTKNENIKSWYIDQGQSNNNDTVASVVHIQYFNDIK